MPYLFCHGCHFYRHCPTPARRAQEAEDFRLCVFYITLSSDEAALERRERWQRELEGDRCLKDSEANHRGFYASLKEDPLERL